jgi:phospholipid/cholesterol/gamma-HCH transport system ATP-binding protein
VGLFKPDQGQILFNGQDMHGMDDRERKELRRQIGMLFQGNALFDSMTVEENIFFPLDMFTTMTRQEKKKRVNEVLERVNLPDAHKKYPAEISGGMKKE